jgi:hypothetical protein
MDERRVELGLTWTEVARRAGLTPEALRLIRTKSTDLQRSTKDGIERALLWTSGSVDAVLADGEPTLRADAQDGPSEASLRAVPVVDEFKEAMNQYREALLRLRRVATSDPRVPVEVRNIVEDWELMLTALEYGGVMAVRQALADSYQRRLGSDVSPDQVG